MTLKIHDKQTAEAAEKSPEARFNYFVFRAVKSEEVWTLADENGFVVSEADGERSIPVWPHAELQVNGSKAIGLRVSRLKLKWVLGVTTGYQVLLLMVWLFQYFQKQTKK